MAQESISAFGFLDNIERKLICVIKHELIAIFHHKKSPFFKDIFLSSNAYSAEDNAVVISIEKGIYNYLCLNYQRIFSLILRFNLFLNESLNLVKQAEIFNSKFQKITIKIPTTIKNYKRIYFQKTLWLPDKLTNLDWKSESIIYRNR